MIERKRKFPIISKNGEITEVLKMSEISLWLENYDYLFSDFDPREYSEKALSDDFLAELKRASKDKPTGEIDISFLISKSERDRRIEPIIKKRLNKHFHNHYNFLNNEKNKVIGNGVLFTLAGTLVMVIATFILVRYESLNFAVRFFTMLSEPGGWFLFWEGLNLSVFEWKNKKPDLDFYKKLIKSKIEFYDY